jgi:ABC-2 type transport system permease protein
MAFGKTFWLPVMTLWNRELVRFWREKARVLGFVGSPLVFWLVIGSGFGDLRFFFPGALTLTVMFSAVFSTMSLIEDRREGFLLSMLVSPAPRSSMVLGKTLGSGTLAWVQGLIFLAFAPLAGVRLSLIGLLEVAGVIFLISITLTLLGFLVAWQMDSSQGFHAIINLLLFPLWMVSGSLFTMEKAHGWIKAVMTVNPLTYSVAALRRLLDPQVGPDTPGLAASLLVTAACALVLLIASAVVAGRKSTRISA